MIADAIDARQPSLGVDTELGGAAQLIFDTRPRVGVRRAKAKGFPDGYWPQRRQVCGRLFRSQTRAGFRNCGIGCGGQAQCGQRGAQGLDRDIAIDAVIVGPARLKSGFDCERAQGLVAHAPSVA